MKHLISTAALVAGMSLTPTFAAANNSGAQLTAHELCERGENKRQVLGGLAGAAAGGLIGNQIAGRGDRAIGSAIGVLAGGFAGAGIADSTVNCDPVFRDQHGSAVSGHGTQHGTQYGHQQHGHQQHGAVQSAPVVYGSSQPYYEDRVTVSNHPVYSDPYYGAGAISQGSTYSAGTVSYPPSGNNRQYYGSQSYSAAPATQYYSAPTTTTTYYPQAQPRLQNASYKTSQPVYTQYQTYSTPVSQQHFHGRHSCNMIH